MKKTQTKIIAGIAIVLLVGFGFYQQQVSRISKNSEPVLFEVTEKENSLNRAIAKLEKEGLIRSRVFTKIQAQINGFNRVYAGMYNFNESMSSYEILDMFDDTHGANQDITIQLTEGFWAKHMAAKLAPVAGIKDQDYIDLWNDPDFVQEMVQKFDFIPKEILSLTETRVLLEGYLYPDTYRINPTNSPEEVTEIILKNSQEKFNDLKELIFQSEFSVHEIYTLASVVEYEAATIKDMRKVAGVFRNRLEIDMPLQASATVCYTLYEFDNWLECESAKNIKIDSPYNTYTTKGLPPGPILNPSSKAIKATLNYKENDYFYFVADVYEVIDGKVHYQETYEEHEEIRIELLGY